MGDKNTSCLCSWWTIILMLIICWPIGLALLIIRLVSINNNSPKPDKGIKSSVIRQYYSIIMKGGETDINEISIMVGKPYDVVESEIQDLINKGVIRDAYINKRVGEIVFTNYFPVTQDFNSAFQAQQQAQNQQPQSQQQVVCPYCGVINVGGNTNCSCCGAPLQ